MKKSMLFPLGVSAFSLILLIGTGLRVGSMRKEVAELTTKNRQLIHENTQLQGLNDSLRVQLEDAEFTIKDVQHTLKLVDEEFGEYMYKVENGLIP